MTNHSAIIRLLSWMSPICPTGAFGYSHGLEYALHEGLITSPEALGAWIESLMETGSIHADAVLCAQAWRAGEDLNALMTLCEYGEALCAGQERHKETLEQGTSFIEAVKTWLPDFPLNAAPMPIAVGAAAKASNINLQDILTAFLTNFSSNLIQTSLRLGYWGQQDGLAVLASLEPKIMAITQNTAQLTLDDISTDCFMADISSLRHEVMETRIFIT